MERVKIGDMSSALVIEITPESLRDLANQIENKSKYSSIGTSVIVPISSSVSFLYNVPIKDNGHTFVGVTQSINS